MNSNVQLRLEGHCDERGTTEYNIALGQRRADAAARFLMAQGILDANFENCVSWGRKTGCTRKFRGSVSTKSSS